MTKLKEGSLFSGYNGLGLGLSQVLDTELAWVSDIDKGACKILAHRYPDIPNHGDLTQIDWSAVEPVDIITGGFPCQDLSHAGKGAGMTADSRSGLWSYMADAINIIRPRLVVAENVRGLLSAEALRPVEPCTWCVGDDANLDMRALGAVLADLADIGYDASWYGLRAADVGACHGRWRCFVVAHPAGSRRDWRPREPVGSAVRGVAAAGPGADLRLLKTPTSQLAVNGGSQHPDKRRVGGHGPTLADEIEHLLPTPRASRGASGTETMYELGASRCNTGRPQGEVLLPTPRAGDGEKGGPNQRGSSGDLLMPSAVMTDFGQYSDAIMRWEASTGRSAPSPTEPTGKGGAHRLSPRFTEWMMGLPAGWIIDVPGLTRNEALKACGNGVVPQQAAAALRRLLAVSEVAA
jgi:DNA (cytosine-5)-methyltransferase 1